MPGKGGASLRGSSSARGSFRASERGSSEEGIERGFPCSCGGVESRAEGEGCGWEAGSCSAEEVLTEEMSCWMEARPGRARERLEGGTRGLAEGDPETTKVSDDSGDVGIEVKEEAVETSFERIELEEEEDRSSEKERSRSREREENSSLSKDTSDSRDSR